MLLCAHDESVLGPLDTVGPNWNVKEMLACDNIVNFQFRVVSHGHLILVLQAHLMTGFKTCDYLVMAFPRRHIPNT